MKVFFLVLMTITALNLLSGCTIAKQPTTDVTSGNYYSNQANPTVSAAKIISPIVNH